MSQGAYEAAIRPTPSIDDVFNEVFQQDFEKQRPDLFERDTNNQYDKNLGLDEAELMKDVAGWEAGANVYKSRYMRPMAPPLMQNDMSQM